ncbi:MAG TPA: 30S ribosomal protein S12 methylthiotransferase RimO [Bellilinea sp.]
MKDKSYYLVSLGCAKNTVDSVSMATLLEEAGYSQVEKPNQAGVMIVNTCGFIHSARQESLLELRGLAARKKRGQILIAAGCMTQRYRELVVEQVPGIDGLIGTRRWMDILDLVRDLRQRTPVNRYHLPEAATVGRDERNVLRAAIQGSSAYLKIADGCRRPCAFCAIPLIKGTLVSRPAETIVEEAQALEEMGVQELILIAQDTTDYGHDLGVRDGLPALLEQLLANTSIPWIRIMYAFPGYVTDRLIEVMSANPRILPYLDMPLQHAHPEMLKRMRRPANMEWVYTTVAKMRAAIPNLSLRSTFIVGYPGETEEEFNTLLDFLREIKLDRAGAFTFSFEEGTASEPLGDPIPAEVKQERYKQFMLTQETISLNRNQSYIGKVLEVLVEGENNSVSVGRSYRDAPEIDGYVVINGKAPVGQIVPVLIGGAMPHDLNGTLVTS